MAQYLGKFIFEGNSIGRSKLSGTSLEFVVPANTDKVIHGDRRGLLLWPG